MTQGWWFPVMASAFLIFTIIIMFIAGTGKYGLGEKGTVDAFVNGASSLVGVSLIIGLARGINLVLNKGMISDTIALFIIYRATYEWAFIHHRVTFIFSV